ncbi:MAG: N5-carboxyaminoimidazole ribonucleotide synthase [Alphaproteobacteria bacterium MarineAlpha2_Bin1]|nr:MAG: N5-carboxyaminoimidazole ribonucleotide synthase [Alphaproteobacteria bacterium MarineAlpha2_Bin1]
MNKQIISGSTIGILGGGQLGKMLCVAAQRLGYKVHIYSDSKNNPAVNISDRYTIGNFDALDKIKIFARDCSIVTFETENIPINTLITVNKLVKTAPMLKSLEITQNRVKEKEFLNSQNIPTTKFHEISNLSNLETASELVGFPAIIKTNRFGYDGKGQLSINNYNELANAWDNFSNQECILEKQIDFEREISVILARKNNDTIEVYEPSVNTHESGILRSSEVTSTINRSIKLKSQEIAIKIANALQHIGIICVEMFLTKEDKILVNEIAPRVHNSGHWTLDGSVTDQFEQHIRSICNLPLGDTYKHSNVVMKNILGEEIKSMDRYFLNPSAKLHFYGKEEIRKNRKMGHLNFVFKKRI